MNNNMEINSHKWKKMIDGLSSNGNKIEHYLCYNRLNVK